MSGRTLLLTFLAVTFCQSVFAEAINRVVFIVPVYREFWNQNIGRMLESVATQEMGNPPVQIELVFNVNNVGNVARDILVENQETVEFLNVLSRRGTPNVRPEHTDLVNGIRAIRNSNVVIRVINRTTGITEQNIGRERDLAIQSELNRLEGNALRTTVIAHMDGDSVIPPNYIRRQQEVYADPNVNFAMAGLRFEVEPNSNRQMWRRAIVTQLNFAHWGFIDAQRAALPISSSPRISSRASALRALGVPAIPHLNGAEDTEFVTRLRERFTGRFLYDVAVRTAFRGRADGYDASWNLLYQDQQIEIPTEIRDGAAALANEEAAIATSALGQWRLREVQSRTAQMLQEASALRAALLARLTALSRRETPDADAEPHEFLNSSWLNAYLRETLQANSNDPRRALDAIVRYFPDLLASTLSQANVLRIRFETLSFALWWRRENPRAASPPDAPLALRPLVRPRPVQVVVPTVVQTAPVRRAATLDTLGIPPVGPERRLRDWIRDAIATLGRALEGGTITQREHEALFGDVCAQFSAGVHRVAEARGSDRTPANSLLPLRMGQVGGPITVDWLESQVLELYRRLESRYITVSEFGLDFAWVMNRFTENFRNGHAAPPPAPPTAAVLPMARPARPVTTPIPAGLRARGMEPLVAWDADPAVAGRQVVAWEARYHDQVFFLPRGAFINAHVDQLMWDFHCYVRDLHRELQAATCDWAKFGT